MRAPLSPLLAAYSAARARLASAVWLTRWLVFPVLFRRAIECRCGNVERSPERAARLGWGCEGWRWRCADCVRADVWREVVRDA